MSSRFGALVLATVVAASSVARADDALEALRAAGYLAAAQAIARRTAERRAKMKLTPAQARAVAQAILRRAPEMPRGRALSQVMPRSFVELVRAVEERGLDPADAEALAGYLVGLVTALDFGNLRQFDENHSHVIGREWSQIDYTGEGTTWQKQRAAWARHGVLDFRKALHLHRYFTAEEKLAYFRRIYRPRGRMSSVPPP